MDIKELDGTEEIIAENGKRLIIKDGRMIDLAELTDDQYWAYMSMREQTWYKD